MDLMSHGSSGFMSLKPKGGRATAKKFMEIFLSLLKLLLIMQLLIKMFCGQFKREYETGAFSLVPSDPAVYKYKPHKRRKEKTTSAITLFLPLVKCLVAKWEISFVDLYVSII